MNEVSMPHAIIGMLKGTCSPCSAKTWDTGGLTAPSVSPMNDYSDGTFSVYRIPSRRGFGAYVDHRWQKYEELMRRRDGKWLWAAYAEYLANRARADGRDPVRVTLIQRWADTLPPGRGPEHGPWQESVMGVFPVGARR